MTTAWDGPVHRDLVDLYGPVPRRQSESHVERKAQLGTSWQLLLLVHFALSLTLSTMSKTMAHLILDSPLSHPCLCVWWWWGGTGVEGGAEITSTMRQQHISSPQLASKRTHTHTQWIEKAPKEGRDGERDSSSDFPLETSVASCPRLHYKSVKC